MPVEIRAHRTFSSRIRRKRLRRLAARTLRAEHARGTLTVYITGNAEIRALNRRFHATDAPTDVLSFPGGGAYIGDIVISYEQAREQARRAGWRIVDELDLLAVHGTLHLTGYDDRTPRQRTRMWQRQAEILGRPIK